MLTPRARKYLAGLERRPHTSLVQAQTSLLSRGYPCPAAWLAFHQQYAGYVEPLGNDVAVWGLTHRDGLWLKLNAAVEQQPHTGRWNITCADAHPSYRYLLDDRGRFLGVPADSFDIKVERNALISEISQRSNRPWLRHQQIDRQRFARLLERLLENVVPEASDSCFRYFALPEAILIEDVEAGRFTELLRADG